MANLLHSTGDVSPGDVTQLLARWSNGDAEALEKLLPVVYGELRRIADNYLRRESPGHTLQPTALVNEAYLRLVKARGMEWQSRGHFFGISANLMRQILVDHARRSAAAKRGGRQAVVTLDDQMGDANQTGEDLLLLDAALAKLEEMDPFAARVVEMRYFAGLTIEETAAVLKTSPTTIKREWATARLWLHKEITGE